MVQRSNLSYIKETHAIEPSVDPTITAENGRAAKTIKSVAKERWMMKKKLKGAEHEKVKDMNFDFKA